MHKIGCRRSRRSEVILSSASKLRSRVDRLDTCALSDALDALARTSASERRRARVLSSNCPPGLRSVTVRRRFSGPAVTVRLDPVSRVSASNRSHLGARALDVAPPGSVIVVDNDGRTGSAAWGGLLSRAARRQRVSGVVVDGLCRDIDEIEALGVPVVARGSTPVTARGRVTETAFNQPVRLGEVTVRPGDWVVSDGSGVVVVPGNRAVEVVELAEALTSAEAELAGAIDGGQPVTQVLAQRYERLALGGSA